MVKLLLEDLRFFIGTFFLVLGLILTFQGAVHPVQVEGYNLNLDAGAGFLIFSFVALGLALRQCRKQPANISK